MTTSMCNNSFVSYMNDWHHQDLGTDFDLFQDLPLTLPSLDGNSEQPTDFVSVNLEPFLLEDDIIKNHDCMWSGNTSPISSHSSSTNSSYCSKNSFIKIKEEPIDLAYTAMGLAVSAQSVLPDPTKPNYKQRKIAPGMSLLKKNQPSNLVKKELGSSYESGRPDTPFSLDDEVKHAVDFYSCSIGSNNIPLEPFDKNSFIKDIRKQLEDPNTVNINLPGNNRIRTMSIIDEVIRDNITDESDTDDDSSMTIMPIRHSKLMLQNSKYINPGAIQTQSDHSYSRSKYGEINYETPIESGY
ncbi:MYC family protein [Megaselia abdita]